ncbi:unnamed protein product, partial [Brassica rapa subsp. narinosa]
MCFIKGSSLHKAINFDYMNHRYSSSDFAEFSCTI